MIRYTVEVARALHARDDVDLSVLAAASARPFFEDFLGRPYSFDAFQRWLST